MSNDHNRFRGTVFHGPDAVKDLMNPDNTIPVPIVELPPQLNPLSADGVRIYAKLMYLLPLLNLKSLPAYMMMEQARREGRLDGVHTIVEASSGNTVFSLAIMAHAFGISNVKAIVPRDIAPGKLEMLRLSGADPMFASSAPNEPNAIVKAHQVGETPGHFNPGQYGNDANPASHERWTASQIWEQLDHKLTVFCSGLGTTGTLLGAHQFFRKTAPHVKLVGVACQAQSAVPGVRTLQRLKEIEFEWESKIDYRVDIATRESYLRSLELCREGLLGGPSSGFNLAGLLHFLTERRQTGELDQLRNTEGHVVAAFLCCDTPLPYMDKYSTHLDAADFAYGSHGAGI